MPLIKHIETCNFNDPIIPKQEQEDIENIARIALFNIVHTQGNEKIVNALRMSIDTFKAWLTVVDEPLRPSFALIDMGLHCLTAIAKSEQKDVLRTTNTIEPLLAFITSAKGQHCEIAMDALYYLTKDDDQNRQTAIASINLPTVKEILKTVAAYHCNIDYVAKHALATLDVLTHTSPSCGSNTAASSSTSQPVMNNSCPIDGVHIHTPVMDALIVMS